LNIPLPPNTSEEGFLYALNNIVMPVLEDFKPDLIINSAGQDNHYTDPITNMKFSAQGYADLTAILKPDIAVLEGGYAIEGALPYVNLGIVLAMAGVDYSHIKEPNYDPESIRQTSEVTAAIEKIGDMVLAIWHGRENLREKLLDKTDPQKRTRNIFYDTDGIQESQSEQIQICPDCAGALRALADAVGAKPGTAKLQEAARPERPSGPITLESIANAIGALLPENAVVAGIVTFVIDPRHERVHQGAGDLVMPALAPVINQDPDEAGE